jgi:hypothetical protein
MKRFWMAFLLFALGAAAQAQVPADVAERLMRDSGMWRQLDGLDKQVMAGFQAAARQGGGAIKPEEVERMRVQAASAYHADALRKSAQAVVAAKLHSEHVPTLRAWFDAELGKRITALEEKSADPAREPQAAVQAGVGRLADMPAARRALLTQLVEVTKAPEAFARVTINTALAVARGIGAARPDQPAPPLAEMRRQLDAQRPAMLQAFAGMALALFADTYAALPDADLERYVAFVSGSAGKHFNDIGLDAFERALVDGGERFGAALPGTRAGSNT